MTIFDNGQELRDRIRELEIQKSLLEQDNTKLEEENSKLKEELEAEIKLRKYVEKEFETLIDKYEGNWC